MKTNISIILNIVLAIALGVVVLGHVVSDHYYKEFTGGVLRKSAEQIKAGHSDLVIQVLGSVKERPTYGDLISTLHKLKTTEPEQSGTGQPDTRPESKSEGSHQPQSEAEGRSR